MRIHDDPDEPFFAVTRTDWLWIGSILVFLAALLFAALVGLGWWLM